MYASQKVSRDLISNEYWKEARADARQMQKINADRQTAIDINNLNQKVSFQADTSVIKPLLQNFSKVQSSLAVIAEQARQDGNAGAASNLNEAVQNFRRAEKATGKDQLFYIEQALAKLPKRGINSKYQNAISAILSGSEGTDYESTNTRLREDLRNIRTAIDKYGEGEDINLPVSVNGIFDRTLGGMTSFDFIRNAPNLNNFYIGAADISTSTTDDGGTTKTTRSVKYSSDIDKK
jgi:hypothetical protein